MTPSIFLVPLLCLLVPLCEGLTRHTHTDQPIDRLQKAEPLTWTHVPKTGSSFLNSLVRLPSVCPDLPVGDMVFGNGGESVGLIPFVKTFPDWRDRCPGLQAQGESSSINSHYMVGSLFDDVYDGHGAMFLRQPEQRFLSMYNHGTESPHLEPFMKSMSLPALANATAGCMVRTLTKDYRHRWVESVGFRGCLGLDDDLQVDRSLEVSSADVIEAKRRLRRYAFVGITDQWPLSVCLLHAMFGGDCHPAEFVNTNKRCSTRHDTAPLQGYVDPYDGALYEEALSIFASNLKRYGVTEQSCQPCFKSIDQKLEKRIYGERFLGRSPAVLCPAGRDAIREA